MYNNATITGRDRNNRYVNCYVNRNSLQNLDLLQPQNGCPFPSARGDVSMATIMSASRMTHQDAVKTALKMELDISVSN